MNHSPEPWEYSRQERLTFIRNANGSIVCYDDAPALEDQRDVDWPRIAACVNACCGIPTHVLENRNGTETNGLKPEDWLLNPVTKDGEGYILASPAGGVMCLSSEQRQRIGMALKTESTK